MAIFHSYVKLPEGKPFWKSHDDPISSLWNMAGDPPSVQVPVEELSIFDAQTAESAPFLRVTFEVCHISVIIPSGKQT